MNKLSNIIHSCLDDSVGQKKPRGHGNAWFWTADLQHLFDHRESVRRRWKRAVGINKALRWEEYRSACSSFTNAMQRRRRTTWKLFCDKLSSGPLDGTTSIIKRIRRNRTLTPQFSHPEGPTAAETTMATHLQQVFSGSSLPSTRYSAPPIPDGSHDVEDDPCPFTTETVRFALLKKLSRRKAPGVDHLRTEMLLPITDDLVPVLTLLFRLCWIWSSVPVAWCTAQVVPIFKKGDPLDPGNFRPISLTSVLRGFRHGRSALDQALCLNKLCRQHTIDHLGETPVLAFLDIKSAYDTVDRSIIWRALETHVSPALLSLLQCLFDKVSIEVLIAGHSSPPFWPRTGVLQGSILSPFLYSIYINSLPDLLRSVRLPLSARYYSPNPLREFDGLWLSCLLYADDVVLIGAADVMPRLLKAAEDHSFSLGHRWNPAKCVILNSPTTLNVPPLKLYGNPIPIQSSFAYLGIPFDENGEIATGLLIQRNVTSAVSAMRRFLLPIGIRSSGFSRLTSSRLYAIFIRPRFEYGLCICTFLKKQLAILDRAQDQCLRLAFGGHPRSSTAVFKHLTNVPSMHVRAHTLVLKMIIRSHSLPDDALLAKLIPFVTAAPRKSRFRWPAIIAQNPLWSNSEFTGGFTSVDDRVAYLSTNSSVKQSVLTYRSQLLQGILSRPDPPVLLSACRPVVRIDPLFLLPMSFF
ncbi:hypothetical protein G6F56_008100 [Rhizopus delemar]|nr:hypothetical protein G6F56_008100 [Rhizopus delemar]